MQLQLSSTGQAVLVVAAVLLIMADLVAVLAPILSAREEKNILFKSAVGEMTIEVSALEECLKRTVLDDPAVGEASVTIRVPERGGTDPIVCRLNLGIHEQSNVPGKADEVTMAAKAHFLDVLPLGREPELHQRVRILRPKRERPVAPPSEPEPAPEPAPEPEPEVPSLDGGLIYGSASEESKEKEVGEESGSKD